MCRKMLEGCCGQSYHNRNKVLPGHTQQIQVRKYGRVNGWSCPLHPLQIVGWFFLVVFAISHFAILVFYLPVDWFPVGIIVPAGGYLVHITYHLLALTLDPADPAVRVKGIFEKGSFDRSKQGHVIQNSFCYICQTKVSSSSKHCSMCNKCVFDFDHHCKWLNNCVGGRNYKLFLGSCISAFGTAIAMFIIDLYLLIVYYIDSNQMLKNGGLNDYQLFPGVRIDNNAYIAFDIVNGLLLLIAIGLLGHLLIFHGYLICNKLSTYDYIVQARQKVATNGNSDVELTGNTSDRQGMPHNERNGDVQSKNYELKIMDVYDGPDRKGKDSTGRFSQQSYDYYSARETSASVCERDARIYDGREETTSVLYEVPVNTCPDIDSPYDSRKQRRDSRTLSRLELLANEGRASDEASSIGSAGSLHDSDVERYNNSKNDVILEDYRTPTMRHTNMADGPARLSEEHDYGVMEVSTRNASVTSRPRSPSPKRTYYTEGGESIGNRRYSYIREDTEDSGIGKADEINSPSLSVTKSTSISRAGYHKEPPSENSSQLSLSNALNLSNALSSRVASQSNVRERGKDGSNQSRTYSIAGSKKSSNATSYQLGTPGREDDAAVHSAIVSNSLVINEFKSTQITNTASVRSATSDHRDASLNATSEDDNMVFEDEFIESNNVIVEQSLGAAIDNWDQGIGHSTPSPPRDLARDLHSNDAQSSDEADAVSKDKLARYVEAFKQKRLSVYSYGSDSEPSEFAIAVLKEESNPRALRDSLDRVDKLSDAFPTASDQATYKKRSLRQPRLRETESMEELSVVEYNRKKKLKKKRPSANNPAKTNLAPLRVRRPSDDLSENRNPYA